MLLNYRFKNLQLYSAALTHPSSREKQNYQRLEFLGDKVLGMVIAELIHQQFPEKKEGELSVIFANLVQTSALAEIAQHQHLGSHLVMDNGEEKSGGAHNPKNLENALEAMIAAIYLDSDYETIKQIITSLFHPYLQNISQLTKKDDKSALQELVQKKYSVIPQYKLLSKTGADHDPTFVVEVEISKEPIFFHQQGVGKTRKAAEYDAAKKMLNQLQEDNNNSAN
jgi:ribonuclease III